jgi:hypothetical protein
VVNDLGFALLTHDPGKCLHPGVIISGATTSFSLFFAALPVSFYLAQCGLDHFYRKRFVQPLLITKVVRATRR